MPNWCSTCFCFSGDKEDIRILSDLLDDCIDNPEQFENSKYPSVDFGSSWLGYPLIKVGAENCINCDGSEHLSCRGSISGVEYDDDGEDKQEASLIVYTETAWCPMIRMWHKIIDALKLTSVKFCAESEEPGMELYLIYDPHGLGYFSDEIYVDTFLPEPQKCPELLLDFDEDRYMDEETFLSMVRESSDKEIKGVEEAIAFVKILNDKIGEENFVYVHQFTRDNDIDNYV